MSGLLLTSNGSLICKALPFTVATWTLCPIGSCLNCTLYTLWGEVPVVPVALTLTTFVGSAGAAYGPGGTVHRQSRPCTTVPAGGGTIMVAGIGPGQPFGRGFESKMQTLSWSLTRSVPTTFGLGDRSRIAIQDSPGFAKLTEAV